VHFTGEFLTRDGVPIRYAVRGHGPYLYGCHGGPANTAEYLARDLAALEDEFSLVYHDYRGSGASGTAPVGTYNFERLADDLDELRNHLGHERIHVVAHSMGGLVALNHAIRHPDRVARLVLVGTTPTFLPRKIGARTVRALGPARMAKLGARALWYMAAWSWRAETAARRRSRYAIAATTQEGLPAARARVRAARQGPSFDNDNVNSLERSIASLDLTPDLGRVRCPTLILYGARDAVAVAGGHLLEAGIPTREVVALTHIGHEVFVEAPEAVVAILRQFLSPVT
jgi:proline iminopeptidase